VKVAALGESRPGERRVALVPEVVARLRAEGWEVVIEAGAGEEAAFGDDDYADAGASILPAGSSLGADVDVVVQVNPPTLEVVERIPEGATVLSFLQPAGSVEALRLLGEKRATVFSFDRVPRISRAQSVDALSSQATVTGYRAALAAAKHLGKFFPMFMTAAGTVPPAKVLVIGAGVAGLQAIATARRLGALVRGYDVRPAAAEEVASLGATFVGLGVSAEGAGGYARELSEEELARQRAGLAEEVANSDVVITTAAVPGKKAPVIVTADMVKAMRPGSVIVDVAADAGGNCELTVPGTAVRAGGTSIVGISNPPATMPTHASYLYARNVANFLQLLATDGTLSPDWHDEILRSSCVLRSGASVDPSMAALLGLPVDDELGIGAATGESA